MPVMIYTDGLGTLHAAAEGWHAWRGIGGWGGKAEHWPTEDVVAHLVSLGATRTELDAIAAWFERTRDEVDEARVEAELTAASLQRDRDELSLDLGAINALKAAA